MPWEAAWANVPIPHPVVSMEQDLLQILRSLKAPHHLLQTHAHLVATGLAASPRVLTALVSAALSVLSSPRHAAAVLRTAGAIASTVAHNTLIERLAGRGGRASSPEDALAAYTAMRAAGVPPNGFTITFLLRACESLKRLSPCQCVHGQIVRCGFTRDVVVQNALLNVYYKCGDRGDVVSARQVFDEMAERDVVSWNSIVGVYMSSGDTVVAMELFEVMPERNVVSWNSVIAGFTRMGDIASAQAVFDRMPVKDAISWNLMISAYAAISDTESARTIFDQMDQKDVVSWTAMVSAYAKIGDLDSAKVLFDKMPLKNLVAWNAMITGYNHNSRYEEALRTFQHMMLEGRFMPDEATLVSVVSACAQLHSSEYSNWISSYISKSNTYVTIALGNALIDMFAKCGDIGRACLIFEKMKARCIITWTTMISGFAFNGQFREALSVYSDMCREGIELDDTVFVAALVACAHGGLLQEGWSIFKQMVEQYRIVPRMEHYGCIVDLLGRSGKLQEAVQFIESMPLKPGVVLWVTLLSSCMAHGNAELIEYVSKQVVEIEPLNSSYQVLVSNCSALEGRWGSVMDTRRMMRDLGNEKVPGSSLIQVRSEVHEFLAKESGHQKRKEIYETLDSLSAIMRHAGHAPLVMENCF